MKSAKQNLKWCNTIETVNKTRTTTTIGPISQKKKTTATTTTLHVQQLVLLDNFACAAHFSVYVTTRTWNFQKPPGYMLYGENDLCVPVHFFCFVHCRSFSVWWPLAFLIFYKTFIFPTKFVLRCFLFLALALWKKSFFFFFFFFPRGHAISSRIERGAKSAKFYCSLIEEGAGVST